MWPTWYVLSRMTLLGFELWASWRRVGTSAFDRQARYGPTPWGWPSCWQPWMPRIGCNPDETRESLRGAAGTRCMILDGTETSA
jgi:hypothetical protein